MLEKNCPPLIVNPTGSEVVRKKASSTPISFSELMAAVRLPMK